jgi:hypothetical protein
MPPMTTWCQVSPHLGVTFAPDAFWGDLTTDDQFGQAFKEVAGVLDRGLGVSKLGYYLA